MLLGSSVLSGANEFESPFQGRYAEKFTMRMYARKKLPTCLVKNLENNVLMMLTSRATLCRLKSGILFREVCVMMFLKLNGFKFMWNLCQLPVFQSVQLAAGVFGLYLNSPLDVSWTCLTTDRCAELQL